jgi:hypothetical protein
VRPAAWLVVASVGLAGCGGGQDRRAAPAPKGPAPTLALADCKEWTELRPDSRRALVEQLRLYFGAKVDDTYGYGASLPDDRALSLLSTLCQRPDHGDVKLYKLYGRAAAFTPPG